MSVIVCVAARMKSTRLPKKAMSSLYGMPLIESLINRVSRAKIPKNIILCTSGNHQDDELADFVSDMGIDVFRGSELDVMDRFIKVADHEEADHIVRVTGDNPLTDPQLIDDMIQYHIKHDYAYTYTKDAPKGVKPEIISTRLLKWLYPQINGDESEYMTYQLMKLLNKGEFKSGLGRESLRLTVDTQDDLEFVRSIYNHFEGDPPPIKEIINWLNQ